MTTPATTSSSINLTDGAVQPASPHSDKSLGELVQSATKDLSLLVHQEFALAKAELKKEVTTAGAGVGMFGGAAFAGVLAVIFLSIALAYGISWLGIGLGWGFLIVGVLYLLVAAGLALTGKKTISRVGPPEKSLESLKEDVAWAKHPTRTS